MPTAANKAIARRYFEELWNEENLAVVDETFAADFVGHGPPNPLFPTGDYHGHKGQKQLVTMYRSAFPDGNFTIEDVVAAGDKVVTRWVIRGTHTGAMGDLPPTGKSVTLPGITIARFANGKYAEDWHNWETLGLMQQLGVVPTPEQSGR
jgi:steroid delta-isomerase-like uncharacterized protein